jgi:hypothetical protein
MASVALLALMAGSVSSSPAVAFGFSDKQSDEISEFIKCKTYLLMGDLATFNDDPDCGKGPVVVEYLGAGGGGGGYKKDEHECEWERPSLFSTEGGEYCYPEYDDE